MANWERKSSYLLREIVKFRTYIDCLQSAQAQKEVIYASRAPASSSGPVPAPGNSEGQEQENQQPDENEEKRTTTSSTDATL